MAAEPTSPESPEESAAAAAASSPGSSTSDPYVGDPGPGFDPAAAPEPPGGDPGAIPEAPGSFPEASEEQVRTLLLNAGDGVHAVYGVGELDWAMTERDLERIAPPLTRIVNRYEPAARVAGQSDLIAVAIGSAMYTWRSLLERQAVLEARGAQTPDAPPAAAAPGPPAPPGYVSAADRLRATRTTTEDTT